MNEKKATTRRVKTSWGVRVPSGGAFPLNGRYEPQTNTARSAS